MQKEIDWLASNELNDRKAIENQIDVYRQKLKGCDDIDDKTYKEFDEKEKQKTGFIKSITDTKNSLQDLVGQNRDKKRVWIETMELIVQKIEENFREHFDKMNCQGRLKFGPCPKIMGNAEYDSPSTELCGEDDFANYGILIWVRFRKESPLKLLSAATQSGGERSVSTMLYLLSMQPVSRSPFRLIDEINQGMDNRNERMIFQALGSIANECKTQYLIITPKLLKGLPYTNKMALNIVHNGKKYGQKIVGGRVQKSYVNFQKAIEGQKEILAGIPVP